MTANTYGRQVVVPLTNKSGGSVAAGDVVVIDTSNNDAFTTSTAGAVTTALGVAQETIASNAVGRVLVSGYAALVNTSASVTRGNFGKTHTVAKQAVDAGASRVAGSFCMFLTGGTTPDAIVWQPDLGAGSGGSGSITASGYTQTTARLLGRTSASTGAIEEITVGSGLSLSAGALTATGGAGGVTFAYGGYNTIGASTEAITSLRIYMKKITLANDCMLGSLELYLDHTADSVAGTPVIGLWSDNSGVPLTLSYQEGTVATDTLYLASSSSSWPARWIGIGSYGKWVTAGDYWVGFMFVDVGSLRLYYDAGADRYMTSGNNWLANGDRYTQTDSTRKYSVRVTTIR